MSMKKRIKEIIKLYELCFDKKVTTIDELYECIDKLEKYATLEKINCILAEIN